MRSIAKKFWISSFIGIGLGLGTAILGFHALYAQSDSLLSNEIWNIPVDSTGMPYCLELKSNSDLSHGAIAIRHHRKDPYEGSVEYSYIQNWSKKDLGRPALCSDAENRGFAFLRHKSHIDWIPFESDRTDFYGNLLPKNFIDAVQQLKWGGENYATETGEAYLTSHNITSFDRELNRQLTKTYNIHFASAVYRAWQKRKPQVKGFESMMLDHLAHEDRVSLAEAFAKMGNPVIAVARYLGCTTTDGGRLEPVVEDFRSLGLDVRLLSFESFNGVDDNAALISKDLHNLLASGKNVILLSASKGAPDALTALANMHDELLPENHVSGYGKLVAYVNIAGVIQGSVLSDIISGNEVFAGVTNFLAEVYGAVSKSAHVRSMRPFQDLASRQIQSRYEWVQPLLPKQPVYLNITGVIPDQGIAVDEMMHGTQEKITRKFGHDYGANDGYLEYPASAIPENWFPRVVGFVTDSSHMIKDGAFNGMVLSDQALRRKVFGAAVKSLSDVVAAEKDGPVLRALGLRSPQ